VEVVYLERISVDTALSVGQTIAVFHLGDVVRKLRKNKKWTLDDLVEKSGVSKSIISDLEQGKGNQTRKTLNRIAKALGTTIEAMQSPDDRIDSDVTSGRPPREEKETMTLLEEIVHRQVPASLTAAFSRTVERIAEEMAEEILRDPTFRAHMRALVQLAVERTLADFGRERMS
jgi:transcriptional regulator with XRE-family HTH domain